VLRLVPQRRAGASHWRVADQQQLYEIAARLDSVPEDMSRASDAETSNSSSASAASAAAAGASRQDRDTAVSPFYHELEPSTLADSCAVAPCY